MELLKNIKSITVALAITITFSACNDYVEEEIYSSVTSENFINENNADQLIVGIYSKLRNVYKNYSYQFLGTDIFTVKTEVSDTNAENDYFNFLAPRTNGYWSSNYNVVAKANTAINRFENQIVWSTGKLPEKAYGIAQARALRALAFFNLAQQYGGVVLDTEEPLTIRTNYKRATEQETYAFIIAELEAAIPNLQNAPTTGRFSKRAAQHLLSQVYLTRAYKSYKAPTDFATAAALAESAIGNYDIRTQTYAKVFDFDNQVNAEVLFAIQWGNVGVLAEKGNTKHSLFQYPIFNYPGMDRVNQYGGTPTGGMPTQYFYSLFAANDTRDDATFFRAIIANKVSGTIKVGDTIVYYPKVALNSTELAKRLNRYWVYQPNQYGYVKPADVSGAKYLYSTHPDPFVHFPIFKKFWDKFINYEAEGSRDTFVFRVAESHLLAAEAHLGAGNTAQALFHLNRVRERATGVANHYTVATIDNILVERALELAGEENRWAVLKRTGKLEERIKLYNPHVIDHGAFDPKQHLLRPIPTDEITISPKTMEQNPFYD
ncbi:RagB/SusD family nutrient uptake outer membrane protein [Flavobacterium sp. UMI-01]|uniref:RagB/SusD family nutrient uptake outer membrane protein n=1 Tax=Flavobacterium sp. UMI-01 TaxID=1441053 RepID=UPI001C7E14C1|nr:RagB/SusD family nutrient uptake outer membrane protein [Flavobacterium sp. UMI-01]GIZ09747.1 membrane protein [Flavobacterium sp. UMI-01]